MDIMTSVGLIAGIIVIATMMLLGGGRSHVHLRTCDHHHLRGIDRGHHDPLSARRDAARPAARREVRFPR